MKEYEEIKGILQGNFAASDEVYSYIPDRRKILTSMNVSWLATAVFGMIRIKHVFRYDKSNLEQMKKSVYDGFADRGRFVYQKARPDALSSYIKTWWSEPMILMAEREDLTNTLKITGFTRRSVFSRLSLYLTMKKFEDELAGMISYAKQENAGKIRKRGRMKRRELSAKRKKKTNK